MGSQVINSTTRVVNHKKQKAQVYTDIHLFLNNCIIVNGNAIIDMGLFQMFTYIFENNKFFTIRTCYLLKDATLVMSSQFIQFFKNFFMATIFDIPILIRFESRQKHHEFRVFEKSRKF